MKAIQYFANLFDRWRLKKFVRKVEGECFEGISTLPIENWWSINSGEGYSHLLREIRKVSDIEIRALKIIWKKIYDEFLKEFGINENIKQIIDKEEYVRVLKLKQIVNDNWDEQTFIDIAEQDLKEMKSKIYKEQSLYEVAIRIEQIMKTTIDTRTCPVKKFYTYIKILQQNG